MPIFSWSQSLHIWKIQRVVFLIFHGHIQMKENVASCLWSISDRTNASTEKIYTSYQSPNTQLLWAWGTRVWHTHACATPTSLKICCIFSFWGPGGHLRFMKEKTNILHQISLSQNPENHWLLITVSLNHEKVFIWNASIWVDGPCISIRLSIP